MPRTYAGPLLGGITPEAMPNAQTFCDAVPIAAASTVVAKDQPGMLYSVVVNAAAVATTVTVYDNASAASGQILWSCAFTGIAGGSQLQFSPPVPVIANNGITVVTTGAASTAIAYVS